MCSSAGLAVTCIPAAPVNSGSGVRVQASGLRVQGSGLRAQGSGLRAQGSGFRVQGSGFRVQGLAAPNSSCTSTLGVRV
jgi:hypothetical protein